MNLASADTKPLLALLERLSAAVEDLLLTGLTTASDSTRQTLALAAQQASQMKLLRLGGTLRVANEELGRFTRNDPEFSRRRLIFFLNRAWLLARGLARAIRDNDAAEFDRMLWTPPTRPIERLDVVTLGVVKKIATGAFCAFEFRLRTVTPAEGLPAGAAFTWSTVFPLKTGVAIPAEGYLHVPQKQKFTASLFLSGKIVTIEQALVAGDEAARRITLTDESRVTAGEPFADWPRFLEWGADPFMERLRAHAPGPFDLETELQEEIVLHDWQLGVPDAELRSGQIVYPIEAGGIPFEGVTSATIEGNAARQALDALKAGAELPPLLGLLHFESCRLILQPLTLFETAGPRYITISNEAVDRAALLKMLSF